MSDFDIKNFKKIAVYAFEEDGLLPRGVAFSEKTYKNFVDMLFPKTIVTEYFLDGPSFNKNNFRYEWYRLLHKCQHGEFDLVLTPSLDSLGNDSLQSITATKELLKKAPNITIYYVLEELSSLADNFNFALSLYYTTNEELIRKQKRTKKILDYMRLTKTWNA